METVHVKSTEEKLKYLQETKDLIKEAIINKGQIITDKDTFRSYVDKIQNISATENYKILDEEEY